MKICSLLPSATEILFALGLGDQVVGVSHECHVPIEATRKPRVIVCALDQDALTSSEIDQAVHDHLVRGQSLYRVELALLEQLKPDLIVTQELCEVCAIGTSDVQRAIARLSCRPNIISLHPHRLTDVFEDIFLLGHETGRVTEAASLVDALQSRLTNVRDRVAKAPMRPRVFCLEWLQPLMACGHWVPDMVEAAGGVEVLGQPGARSRYVDWSDVVEAQPEMMILMPCGFPIQRTRREIGMLRALPGWDALPAVKHRRVYLVDGPAYFNCSGPRLVDGVELLAELLHPDRCRGIAPAGSIDASPAPLELVGNSGGPR